MYLMINIVGIFDVNLYKGLTRIAVVVVEVEGEVEEVEEESQGEGKRSLLEFHTQAE